MRRLAQTVVALGISLLVSCTAFATSASASYSGSAAANYADTYAINNNLQYISYSEDCANFVSQAMYAGGFSFVNPYGSPTDLANWWDFDAVNQYIYSGHVPSSNSATVADDLWQFLHLDNPGGTFEGSFSYNGGANTAPAFTPNSVVTGDALFYDWGQGLGISHTAMQVGWGTDQYGYYGNWVDEHTSNRQDIFGH